MESNLTFCYLGNGWEHRENLSKEGHDKGTKEEQWCTLLRNFESNAYLNDSNFLPFLYAFYSFSEE